MQALDRKATDKLLQAGLDYLKQTGRKVATIEWVYRQRGNHPLLYPII